MGRSVQVFLPFVPPTVTHNDLEAYTFRRKGKTKAGIRKSDRLRDAEAMMLPYIERAASGWTCLPLKPPVRETLKICWPTEGRHGQGELRVDPPDLDNWEKAWHDLLERAGVVRNDAHIADKRSVKVWADPPGVFVRLEELPQSARGQDG